MCVWGGGGWQDGEVPYREGLRAVAALDELGIQAPRQPLTNFDHFLTSFDHFLTNIVYWSDLLVIPPAV